MAMMMRYRLWPRVSVVTMQNISQEKLKSRIYSMSKPAMMHSCRSSLAESVMRAMSL